MWILDYWSGSEISPDQALVLIVKHEMLWDALTADHSVALSPAPILMIGDDNRSEITWLELGAKPD